ncbi:OmpA family protein [Vibrio owensii]|uniref:OmpA family protein n=1 Tax=Vibrio owensii TaxID=696485 RepID=UPI0018F152AD|nr:OmpA family protein [Vibrio owensii]
MKRLLFAVLFAPSVIADSLSDIEWSVQASLYQCDIRAELPYKNLEMLISAVPEEPMSLTVLSRGFELFDNDASLSISTPYWVEKGSRAVHAVTINEHGVDSIYSTDDIEHALEQLKDGFWLTLHDGTKAIEFPSIDMGALAVEFRQCQDSMPLMKYESAKDVDLWFDSAGHRSLASGNADGIIVSLASVVLKDKSVVKVLIDGHTDSLGDEIDNLELSHKRASYVAMQLVDRGIPVDKIEIRAHGERYPEFTNKTKEGRQKNRRVNVRLVKSQ